MTDPGHKEDERMDRRKKKTPLERMQSFGGVGSLGVGAIIINLLLHQNATLDLHGDLIRENRQEQEVVLAKLREIKAEFGLDIQTFHLKHLKLEDRQQECKVGQKELVIRLNDLEQGTMRRRELEDFERSIRTWVSANFRKHPNGK